MSYKPETNHKKTIRHWYFYVMMATNIFAAWLLILLIYWSAYPYKLIDFEKEPFKVSTKQVKAGGTLIYKVPFCKYTPIRPSITRVFSNDILYTQPVVTAIANPLGCHTNNIQAYVPKELPPGIYHLNTIYRYQVNPIRTIDISTETEQFEVIN